MAKSIIELTRGVPTTDREWIALFSKLGKHLKVDGNSLVITPDIVLPDGSVETNEIADLAVTGPKIAETTIGLSKLTNAAAASVLGRASGTAGARADIAFSSDGQFLKRESGGLVASTIADGDIPASIARDSEVSAAITAHEGAADPHPTYTTAAELSTAITNAIAALNLTSGEYTPTISSITNIDSTTAYASSYLRVGEVVTVSGRVDVDATATGNTVLAISLPIASNFSAINQCAGVAANHEVPGHSAAIFGDTSNDRAQMQYNTTDTADRAMFYTFTYVVI